MDDVVRVRCPERIGDLHRDAHGPRGWELAGLGDRGRERLAVEQLHDDVGAATGLVHEVRALDDVLVANDIDRARLGEEPREQRRIARDLRLQRLDRDRAAERDVHAANRMYQHTRDPRHRTAALAWLERVLAQPLPPGGSLLSGTTGVALALLAMATDLEPEWDRLLLADLPVR